MFGKGEMPFPGPSYRVACPRSRQHAHAKTVTLLRERGHVLVSREHATHCPEKIKRHEPAAVRTADVLSPPRF